MVNSRTRERESERCKFKHMHMTLACYDEVNAFSHDVMPMKYTGAGAREATVGVAQPTGRGLDNKEDTPPVRELDPVHLTLAEIVLSISVEGYADKTFPRTTRMVPEPQPKRMPRGSCLAIGTPHLAN